MSLEENEEYLNTCHSGQLMDIGGKKSFEGLRTQVTHSEDTQKLLQINKKSETQKNVQLATVSYHQIANTRKVGNSKYWQGHLGMRTPTLAGGW